MPLDSLVREFITASTEEAPSLAKGLDKLDEDGKRELAGILGRFDFRGQGKLDAQQRLFARRVLGRLHRLTTTSLTLTNQILDYLDLNSNALLEPNEVEFAVEILEMFAKADSINDTLSERELRMLYAVLRHLDSNDNRVLDKHEVKQLHDALEAPSAFLARQKRTNPLFAEI